MPDDPANAENAKDHLDALVVGAGPTGLTLAAQLHRFGARFRIVDRLRDRIHESRALGVHARSLEILDALGLAHELVSRGNPAMRIALHLDRGRTTIVRIDDIGIAGTRFPYILFVSQAETEAVLSEHLESAGVRIERGVELAAFSMGEEDVTCTLRHDDGRVEHVRALYLAGCDGAHSTVRKGAGIPFEGGAYPQDFVLGDVEADGPLEPGALNAFPARAGVALFLPLGRPTTWRLIGIEPPALRPPTAGPATLDLSLPELQALADAATGGRVRLRDPAWLARFRLHHRQAATYRAGRAFLAGDAAHIHSPIGAQGMNTGIQDAWNLGWKLALVVRGRAAPGLLDTYDAERWPVGRFLLRFTDRLFAGVVAITRSRLGTRVRNVLLPPLLRWLMSSRRRRARLFRLVSQLGIRYRRSPLAVEAGTPPPDGAPRAGDRLPDATLVRDDGSTTTLHRETAGPAFHLLLCGPPDTWDEAHVVALRDRWADLLSVHHLTRDPAPGAIADHKGEAFACLGVRRVAQLLLRPDGHIGFRADDTDLAPVARYLEHWLTPAP